ncbi:MAG TPA: helical backbone metal receptor [Chitinophagales bacterium]|nr:helical backbone metal receptor [Chitinophagales bacterium]
MAANKIFTDQLSREIAVSFPPKRIISIVPSQSELLFYLGLDDEVAGITKFCIHPRDKFRAKQKVGGTKKIDFQKIKSLHPDLVIANKEENDELQVKMLMNYFPVWVSDVKTIRDAFEMIEMIGALVNKEEAAAKLVTLVNAKFNEIVKTTEQYTAAYLIWRKPFMAAGRNTFINSMMETAGFQNVFTTQQRYPEITLDSLKATNPEYILLSSEPYPFSSKHVTELQKEIPGAKILLVDGEMFSWYGSRLLKAADYLQQMRYIKLPHT